MKGRSSCTQMVQFLHSTGEILDNKGQVDILYLDSSKAFDSVSHHLLLHKLQKYGFHGNLLSWMTSYLTNRRQRVIIEGACSDWLPVISGVPQGSIIGPVLFLLYINDMPDTISDNFQVCIFADDSKCMPRQHHIA
jgi:ribonuclease P/MRP protein subunit RPP40